MSQAVEISYVNGFSKRVGFGSEQIEGIFALLMLGSLDKVCLDFGYSRISGWLV